MSKFFRLVERCVAAAVLGGMIFPQLAMAADYHSKFSGSAARFQSQMPVRSNATNGGQAAMQFAQRNNSAVARSYNQPIAGQPQQPNYHTLGRAKSFGNSPNAGQVNSSGMMNKGNSDLRKTSNIATKSPQGGVTQAQGSAVNPTKGGHPTDPIKSGGMKKVDPAHGAGDSKTSGVPSRSKNSDPTAGGGKKGTPKGLIGPGDTADPIPPPEPHAETPPSGPGVETPINAGMDSKSSAINNGNLYIPPKTQETNRHIPTTMPKGPVNPPNTTPGGANGGVEPGQGGGGQPGGGGGGQPGGGGGGQPGGGGGGQPGGGAVPTGNPGQPQPSGGSFPWPVVVGGALPWNAQYQPAYTPAQPVVSEAPVVVQQPAAAPIASAVETAPSLTSGTVNVDLVLEDVELAEEATKLVGPAYRVKFRNQGTNPVGKFRVAVVAGIDGQTTKDSPRAALEVNGLAGGQVGEVTIRLPKTAMRLVSASSGEPTAFTHLLVAVDCDNAIRESDKNNNVAMIERTELEAAR